MKTAMEPVLTIYIHKGEKMYVAECLEIDVITQGNTIDEAIKNIKEAIALYFENKETPEISLPDEPPVILGLGIREYVRV